MNLFELQAVLTLNSSGYTQGLKDAEDEGNSFLGKVQSLTRRAASAYGTVKTAVQGAKTVLSPIIGIVTDAVEAYGDYEQAIGGVQKLFGNASKTITENARQAFKTAGVSINDYMDMCIQSGAAMLRAVGGDSTEAAGLMNTAIIDMADNVNALGNSMEAVQYAYRGFARGNFTMLDNLALGYAGTKEGMEELLADAEALSGVHYDIGNYADIVRAIHVIQASKGITGTSSEEAATTQIGSKAAMEAAKQNLLVTLADSEASQTEKDQAAKDYAEAVVAYLKNLLPVITEVLKSLLPALGEVLTGIADGLGLSGIIDVIKAIKGVVESILDAFGFLEEYWDDESQSYKKRLVLPEWLKKAVDIIAAVISFIANLIKAIVDHFKANTGRTGYHVETSEYGTPMIVSDVNPKSDENPTGVNWDADNLSEPSISDYFGYSDDDSSEQPAWDDYGPQGWAVDAKGEWDVPYDNYLAKLHRDEMVLTASQARQYREGKRGGMDTGLMYQTIADAVAAAVSNIQINMDGESVGNAVSGAVSRNIYRKSMSRRYG